VKYLALTGGIGGAKLAVGLSRVLQPGQLAFVVNTGDDFRHLGLHISPDIDTLVYTLAELANPETGWGRRDESWQFMAALAQLGGESWFNLGDRDLAMHVERTRRLAGGESLTQVTQTLAAALGVPFPVLPMSDDPVQTCVLTTDGWLDFQHYFVRERCAPAVSGFEFRGAERAAINPEVLRWLDDPQLAGVILCPSNPFVSMDPMLALPGMKEKLARCAAPVIAVSPVVGGTAIKGPTVKMMGELSLDPSAAWVAQHYRDFLSGFVIDVQDAALQASIERPRMSVTVAQTVMNTPQQRVLLAQTCLRFLSELA
jgi:LPPG:FO 2-phospho-L-lactate transferase